MKVIVATRRGRPPKPERQARDHGTPELVLRRQLAVGNADPALAVTPLGIMECRGLIDLDERAAGETYRQLYGSATGRAREIGLDPCLGIGNDDALERITEQYRSLTTALLDKGRSILMQVVDVAVFQISPYWLRLGIAKNDSRYWQIVKLHQHIDYVNLLAGLRELNRVMGRR